MLTIIKVYEVDYDYNYERLFLVDISEEQKEELQKVQEDLDYLDYDEREEKYGSESKIDCVENYITKNFKVVEHDSIEVDCY
jgi:hypothetical protein